jgi:hypothetical protein
VVVAVGLMLVVPLASVEVKVPGVMLTLVAPLVAQLSVLLEPELMVAGLAEKDVIVGAEPFPEDEVDTPQPARPRLNRRRMRSRRRGARSEKSEFLDARSVRQSVSAAFLKMEFGMGCLDEKDRLPEKSQQLTLLPRAFPL